MNLLLCMCLCCSFFNEMPDATCHYSLSLSIDKTNNADPRFRNERDIKNDYINDNSITSSSMYTDHHEKVNSKRIQQKRNGNLL